MSKSAFDIEASHYDERFTLSEIGKLQRKRVYYWLNKINFFDSKKKVFEVNCGTGYDAEQFTQKGHQLIATDASIEMIEVAKSCRSSAIQFYQSSFNEIEKDKNLKESEVLFSNFGGLNCLSPSSLQNFFNDVAIQQKSGDLLIVVLMGKKCLWEDVYFLLKGERNKLGRRNTNQGIQVNVGDTKVETYYHSPKELKKYLKDSYRLLLLKPVAFFLPPSYLEPFFKRHKILLSVLNNLEHLFGRFRALASWSDHYIIIAERK